MHVPRGKRVGLQRELQSSSYAVKQTIATTAGFERLHVTRRCSAWREVSNGKVLKTLGYGFGVAPPPWAEIQIFWVEIESSTRFKRRLCVPSRSRPL